MTAAFRKSIVPPRGGDFDLLQAVWETQERLSEACKPAGALGGPEADALWKRVGAVRREAVEVLATSKRLHESWKRHQPSGNEQHRTDGPEPVISIPQYLGKENGRGRPADYVARKAAKSLHDQQIRSRMKGRKL